MKPNPSAYIKYIMWNAQHATSLEREAHFPSTIQNKMGSNT